MKSLAYPAIQGLSAFEQEANCYDRENLPYHVYPKSDESGVSLVLGPIEVDLCRECSIQAKWSEMET